MATTATTQPRAEKVAVVNEVRERFGTANAVLLTDYRGLKVGELADLRSAVREAGGEYRIFKNTLVRLATDDGPPQQLSELLVGPTALAFVDGDAVAVAKALQAFAKDHPALVVKGGLLGESFLTADQAADLAKMASRDELLARLAGGLAAPLQKLASLLSALPRNFAYALSALVEKGGAAPEAPAAEAAPEVPAAEAAPEAPAAEAAPEAPESTEA